VQGEHQRVLPTIKVNSSVRRHAAPTVLSTPAITTTNTTPGSDTTTTTTMPSGESASSRVLPPVNVSDLMSKDQLRQRTERIIYNQSIVARSVSDSSCDMVGENDVSHVSANAGSDNVNSETVLQESSVPEG